MSHPGWVMVSFLTELLSSYGGFGRLPTSTNCANDTEVIDNLLKDSYNKHYIPNYPTRVRVDMWVQEVTAVSELTQDFEIGKRHFSPIDSVVIMVGGIFRHAS